MNADRIDWWHFKKRLRPIIEMLHSCFGWNEGDRFTVQMEDKDYIYFDDAWDRWTALEKSDERKEFIYIRYKELEK